MTGGDEDHGSTVDGSRAMVRSHISLLFCLKYDRVFFNAAVGEFAWISLEYKWMCTKGLWVYC